MIKIKIDDTIVDIVEKIESQKSGDVVLDFPLGHPLLHNYISLKILKSKTGNRNLIIATNDRIGKKIGKRLGIEYSLIKDKNFLEESSQNSLMQHNFTFWEYFKFQLRSYIGELRGYINTNKKIHSLSRYSRIYQEKISLHIFIGTFLFSLSLFLFIYYFAISKTYIYITPEIIIRKEAHNFIFNESTDNSILGENKSIKIDILSQKVGISETYASTGIKSNVHDASSGKVRFYNILPEEQQLIAHTRLQTPDGIVFEILEGIKIPAGIKDNFENISPGILEVTAQAKLKNSRGEYTGTKGNITKNIQMTLPGLALDLQDKIYAESIEDFSGGRDDFQKIVTKEDIDRATELFTEKLKNDSLKYIKNIIYNNNIANNSQIEILSGGKSISYHDLELSPEEDLKAGNIQDQFQFHGSIIVRAYTYNKESIIQKLKSIINERSLEGIEKISLIDTSSLRMSEILYSQDRPFEMKATFEIEALFLHDFLNRQNSYMSVLQSKIRGLSKNEAEKILLNDPKISRVSIKIRPFFMKNISNISNNIIFKLE